jgi:hypothetical protein
VDLNGEESKKHLAEESRDFDYNRYLVKKIAGGAIPASGSTDQPMILMSNNLVPGSNNYIEAHWVNGLESPGPDTRPGPDTWVHTHNFDEILLFIGGNWEKPEELGGEVEFMMEGQRLKIEKTAAVLVPEGIKHGLLTVKKFLNPYLELKIMAGVGSPATMHQF